MTFAALRQKTLQAFALGEDRFAEDISIGPLGEELTVRAKITHRQVGELSGTRQIPSQMDSTYSEQEMIEVLVSRDPFFAKSLPTRPQSGDALRRDETLDSDQRPFSFDGEVVFEGDQHAVYVFQRPRRIVQGRSMG